ncbi:BON domain-containing protein [Hydrogenophaga sp. OTU3427]|uniref:BON domain-containing protein n=1 Tax=Hydrogenophaga sp. OTU3427 TaxID=3043856 RepID=UPI00313A776F
MTQSRYLLLALSAIALAVLTTACGKTEPVAVATVPPPATTTIGTEVDDSVMTTAVKAALLTEATLKSMDVMVETRKGEVQLSGFVDDQHQIALAETVARGVAGVKTVDNKLSLKVGASTVGNKIDDTVVTARVKTAFTKDDGIKGMDIAVETRKGEVILSGFVDNRSQIDRALILAKTIEGVHNVRNDLVVKQ